MWVSDLQTNFLDKLKKEVPVYRLLGHLNDIIQLERTNVDSLLNSAESHTEDCAHLDKSKRVQFNNYLDKNCIITRI